jgi:hypothetical protein
VKSWNQLCAGWKPLTLADIARGFRSWTILYELGIDPADVVPPLKPS